MKKIFVLLLVLLNSIFCFAERKVDFVTGFAPMIIVNTEDATKSAPSPVVYPITLGLVYPQDSYISFQPQLSFYTNYYLYTEAGAAAPAEIENRTATAFNFLLDLPVEFTLKLAERHNLGLGVGPSILARFGVLSAGVDSSEPGASGTASDDVSEINKWFWDNARFLYLQGNVHYLFKFSDMIQAGPELRLYLPCGSIFTGDGLNATMIAIGIKARF